MSFLTVVDGKLSSVDEEGIPEYQQDMINKIENVEQKCWLKGDGFTAPHFEQITVGTSGFDDGLYFIAGAPNTGKSAFVMNLVYDLVEYEKNNMFALYFSLDDTLDETLPRLVAMDQKIKIDVVKRPSKYSEDSVLISKRKTGFNNIKKASKNMVVEDSNTINTCEQIEDKIKEYKIKLVESGRENAKFIIVIDSFDDLDSRDSKFGNKNDKSDFMAKWVKDLMKNYDCIVMCTKHLRKLNGYRRPIMDDLKDSGTVAYEASCTLLCHNEVGLKGEKADIFYERDGFIEKQPIVEVHFGKNKLGSYKGRIFTEFIPDYSRVVECSPEACKQFNSMVFQA